jgi:adenylate cyclase
MRDDSPIHETIRAAQAEGLTGVDLDCRVWERHGTTCAVLALDSSGMTRISLTHGIVHFLARYQQMCDLAEEVLGHRGCIGWRSFADNLFAEFADPDAALTVAQEIHASLKKNGLMLTDAEPYRVCIAIGYGSVLKNGAFGVMGDEMNLAAKLAEDIAEGGETLLSDAARRGLEIHADLPLEKCQMAVAQVDVTYFRVRG